MKKRKVKSTRFINSLCLLGFMVAIIVCIPVYGYLNKNNASKAEQTLMFARQAPDYTKLSAVETAQDSTSITEGTVSISSFRELTGENTLDFLERIRPVLGDNLYTQLLGGMSTDYYSEATKLDYQDLSVKVDDMLVEAGLINALYNKYRLSYEGMVDFDGCASGEACEMLQFINKYTSGELKDFLMTAHGHWESLVYYEMQNQEVTDGYLKLFYQDEICNNFEYLQNYDVSFVVLNSEQLSKSFEELQRAYDNGSMPVTTISNYGDNDSAIPSKKALEKMELYKDLDFYDGTFAELASDTIQTLFAEDVVSGTEYLGGSELASSSSALKQKIKEASKASTSVAQQEKDYSKLENWNVQQYSLSDRNPDDVLYILWKINRVKHTDSIPTMESIKDKLVKKAKVYQAQKKLSATIQAEKEGMTDDEVESFINEIYSGHAKTTK